jgi:hypothetical protein
MRHFHDIFEPRPTGIVTEDAMPTVLVETTPNGITRNFRTNEILTITPHIELLGRDRTAKEGKPPIDTSTAWFLDKIRSTSEAIKSVTIEPYQLSIDGPHYTTLDNRLRGNWPPELELQVIICLAHHLGCQSGIHIERRHLTEQELHERIEAVELFRGFFLNHP